MVGKFTEKLYKKKRVFVPVCKKTKSIEDFDDPEILAVEEDIEEEAPCALSEEIEAMFIEQLPTLKRTVKKVVWHCTGTSLHATVTAILRYWFDKLNWKNPGYHIAVKHTGLWVLLHSFNNIANGVKGHNQDSIHISWIGGLKVNDMTPEQKATLLIFYKMFKKYIPEAEHYGHNAFSNKACPRFDSRAFFKQAA